MCSIYRASCECDFRQSRVDLALKERENKSVHTLRYIIEKRKRDATSRSLESMLDLHGARDSVLAGDHF